MTAQEPDFLIHRRRRFDLMETPLEPYLDALEPDRRPRFQFRSTACWRGYVATWRVAEGRLLLVGLTGRVQVGDPASEGSSREASLALCFPWLHPPVSATWFTGWLRCPEGRMLSYVHAGFSSAWERDRWLFVEEGMVRRERVIVNPPPPFFNPIDRPRPQRRPKPLYLLRGR